jgi:hypothetical protein
MIEDNKILFTRGSICKTFVLKCTLSRDRSSVAYGLEPAPVDNAANGKSVYSFRVVRISNMFKTGMMSDLIMLSLLILIGPVLMDYFSSLSMLYCEFLT